MLVIGSGMGITIFTHETPFDLAQNSQSQEPGPPPKRGAQSPGRKSAGPVVFARDLLRPRGLAAGQIEMLRRVQQEGIPVGTAAASFGFSRPSFYKAREDF